MEKKEQVFQIIRSDTNEKIQNRDYDHLGLDAFGISLTLKTDRANISRILNKLYNEGRLVKTSSRPVLFFDRSALDTCFHDISIPSIIPADKTITDYILSSQAPANNDTVNSFSRYICNARHSKMYEPIQKAKSAVLYPYGLNILIHGEQGSGRLQFAKALINYAKEINFIDQKQEPHILECLNYNETNQESLLKLLFGEYIIKSNSQKKGIFQTNKSNIIVLNNFDSLPPHASNSILNAILDRFFSPLNTNKRIELKVLVITTVTSDSIINNTKMRQCFPMLIEIPNLQERSIIEKLVIILQYFQDEASKIDKTIRISKDALSCFVMSEYKGNLAHLRAEIRQSCALGYQNHINNNSLFINIGFDEISTPVLTNIFNVNDRLNELYDTLNLFKNDYLFFSSSQSNSELTLLYDLNKEDSSINITNIHEINDELINLCISDINSASNIQLNSIRSILLQRIYDILYPLIINHSIQKNENLLYGLFLHISNVINHFSSGHTGSNYYTLRNKIARPSDYECANNIRNAVNKNYGLQLPEEEIDYISTYLYLSSQWIEKKYIQMLIVSSSNDMAKSYADYINGQQFKSYASFISIDQNESFDAVNQRILNKMIEIDRGKGVIIACDLPETKEIDLFLQENYSGEYTMLYEISVQKLVTVAKKLESLGVTIQNISSSEEFRQTESTQKPTIETHAQELLNNIEEKLLSESLVFLNPKKACQILYNVFLNILSDLSISYSDDLLIKFLFHTAFSLERCISKNTYTYPKARSLIKKYNYLFNTLDKNFKIVNEVFSIQIPAGEMGFIIEIFLPYMTNTVD